MDNVEPFEILASPFTAWLAEVGTAFPAVDAEPAVDWMKIGTSGDLNYTEDGVTVAPSQTINLWRPLGGTGPRKAFRSAEDLKISFTVADLTLEQFALALNNQTVTTETGKRTMGLSRGLAVKQWALLVRGASPYGDDLVMQFEVPVCIQTAGQSVQFRKNEPAGLALEFTALEDPDAASDDERFGRIVAGSLDT